MKINEVVDKKSQILSIIEQNCSKVLTTYRKEEKYLSRYIDVVEQFIIGKSKNRKPSNTPNKIQKIIDEKLKGAGFEALRSNSIFCSTHFSTVEYGGFPYIVFPYDDMKFTYSPNIEDLTVDWELMDGGKKFENELISDISKMTPQKFIEYYNFRNKNFSLALRSECEFFFIGKYVAIADADENYSILHQLLPFVKAFNITHEEKPKVMNTEEFKKKQMIIKSKFEPELKLLDEEMDVIRKELMKIQKKFPKVIKPFIYEYDLQPEYKELDKQFSAVFNKYDAMKIKLESELYRLKKEFTKK